MKKFICIQAGHENTNSNCEAWLHGLTGAPLEMETNVRIRNRLSEILIAKGFMVQLVDANFNCDPKAGVTDFDLFLALHCDSDYAAATGGFVDFPDPSEDDNNAESKRIRDAISSMYFANTGIVEHPERSNPNTKFYYMWQYLSAKTPCVILEMGESADAHDRVILNDTERVASAIARGICKAFDVPYDTQTPPSGPTPPTTETVTIKRSEYDGMKKQISDLTGANERLTSNLALKDDECKQKLQAQHDEMKKKVLDLAGSL